MSQLREHEGERRKKANVDQSGRHTGCFETFCSETIRKPANDPHPPGQLSFDFDHKAG